MEIVGGRDDKVFNEVGNIPEPAKGIPPVAAGCLGGRGLGNGRKHAETDGPAAGILYRYQFRGTALSA